jgi:hypothetical protein
MRGIEEADQSWVFEANWSDLWKERGRSEPAPAMPEVLAPLVAAGLVENDVNAR